MSLPIYHHIHLKNDSIEEILGRLSAEMNTRAPVAIHLESFSYDQQRECIGVIENYFDSKNISFEYPYPIYIIAEVESSSTGMPLVRSQDQLPRFYFQKEGRMNVKETHLALKNRLLQQEIKNVDPSAAKTEIENYAEAHKVIFEMEAESVFYKSLLSDLKGKKRG